MKVIIVLLSIMCFVVDNLFSNNVNESISRSSQEVKTRILSYILTRDLKYLSEILQAYQQNNLIGFIEYADYRINKRLPSSDWGIARLRYLENTEERVAKCIISQQHSMGVPASNADNIFKGKEWTPSEMYVEGMFKLVRAKPPADTDVRDLVWNVLKVTQGETVGDIGFGSGQHIYEMAMRTGIAGKAIGVEISPALVDFVNFMSKMNNIPQLEARISTDTDIGVEDNTFDVVLIRFVFSNLRGQPQPWVNSIYKAMKPGGRVIIIQHYSPDRVKANRIGIDLFLSGAGDLPSEKSIPSVLRSPEVVVKMCKNAGFEVHNLIKGIAPEYIYILEVRKPE